MPVERKYERDVDLLLAEELLVNPAFAEWMTSLTRFAERSASLSDVLVSKSDTLGESDLIAIYTSEGSRFALMIEDKVDAILQPMQAERYRLRGERERKAGKIDDFTIILCAPRHYIHCSEAASKFDRTVSFEEIAKFLRENDPSPRGSYRAAFLEEAAVRRTNNWTREIDGPTNAFWDAAYELATREFPILEMKRLKVTKDSTWINFRPADMPTMPRRVYISVKGDSGYMDLTISNTRACLMRADVVALLEPGMSMHQTSASTAIRIVTPGFKPSDGIELGLAKVRLAFQACERLIRFYRIQRKTLDAAAEAASR